MTETAPAVRPPGPHDALVVVDVQNDFVSGALAVPGGDEVIAPLNRAIALFGERGLPIVATRDWHPPDHCSFAAQGGPWPVHCVADDQGADYAPGLALPAGAEHILKATRPEVDAYSGFSGTDLAARLRERDVRRVFVGGLATDYCVLNTVRDAIEEGLEVVVLGDAVRAVDADEGDGARAEDEMRRLGAGFLATEDLRGTAPRE